MKRQNIAVIGGGVVGVTTAILLLREGYPTIIYAGMTVHRGIDPRAHPDFATLFPAAAIIPHSVEMPDLLEVFADSQAEFHRLARIPQSGVRRQEHYEITTSGESALPSYVGALRNSVPFGSDKNHIPFGDVLGKVVTGWVADILFAEMPVYIDYLYDSYGRLGGTIEQRTLKREDIASLHHDCIVNCTGLGARGLFDDTLVHPVRGHLLMLPGAPFPPGPGGRVFSYNYTPDAEVYPFDVYCFPRTCSSGWVLGGSREVGLNNNGDWIFSPLRCRTIGDCPAPVFDLNRKILLHLTGTDISTLECHHLKGFRPGRTGGVRIEAEEFAGKQIIHNYGHGGAGVALSWGSARKAIRILKGRD